MKLLLLAGLVAAAHALSLEVRHEYVSAAGGSCTGKAVSLYQHDHFRGLRASFGAGECDYKCFIKKMYNDQASSIKVPKGCIAYLYQHAGFGGWRAIFPPGDYNMRAFMARGAKNDDASSIKVFNQKVTPPKKAKRCKGKVVRTCTWKADKRCGHKWETKCRLVDAWNPVPYKCRKGWFRRWKTCYTYRKFKTEKCHRFNQPFCVHGKRRSCKTTCRAKRAVQDAFKLKYADKWPHCENIECPINVHLSSMKARCQKNPQCNGFSWTRGSTAFGWGCLKKSCVNDGRNGFGKGSHGYYEKRLRRAPAKTYTCTLTGDPHIKSFTMAKGYYNHYDMGVFTAFKNRYVRVQVKNGKSTTWGNNAVIHSVRVNFGGKRYAVGISQKNCETSGNLRSTQKFGSVTVSWAKSCRKKVGDRHFDVKITYKGRNLDGVSGSCIKAPKKRVNWAAVNKLAQQKCGADWKNTLTHMKKRCGRKRNMACYQDQIYKICAERSAKLAAAASSRKLAAFYANKAVQHDKNSKLYKWYQENYASKADKYTRSARGYHARADAHAKSEFKSRTARKAYLKERAEHLKMAARHARTASVWASKASASYTAASKANRDAAAAQSRAVAAYRKYEEYRSFERRHRTSVKKYEHESAAHGRRAAEWHKKAQAAKRRAKAAAAKADKYNAKIKRFCSLWKKLAGEHAKLATKYYEEAAAANGHLLKSKRFQKKAADNAAASAREANRYSKLAGQRLSAYYKEVTQRNRRRALEAAHRRAARANDAAAAKYRLAAKASRARAARADSNAARHAKNAATQAALSRLHRGIARSHEQLARQHKATSANYGKRAAGSESSARSARGTSASHSAAAAAAAKAAAALGF